MPVKPRHHKGGRVNPRTLPKGPNGRALCRQCGVEVPPSRRTFCGQSCVDQWMIRTGSRTAKFVLKRDGGICALCGLDCVALRKQALKLKGIARQKFMADHGIPLHRVRRFWDIDHVLPVVEGGGDCGLENLRSLCIPCHRKVTAELARKRAEARKSTAG